MGNTLPKQVDDVVWLKIDESLVAEFKSKMTVVEHSVLGLAKSIDALDSFHDTFSRRKSERCDTDGYEDVVQTMNVITECIFTNKDVVVQSVDELLKFISETGMKPLEIKQDVFATTPLHMYRSGKRNSTASAKSIFGEFLLKLAFLEKENELLGEKEKLQNEEKQPLRHMGNTVKAVSMSQSDIRSLSNSWKNKTEDMCSEPLDHSLIGCKSEPRPEQLEIQKDEEELEESSLGETDRKALLMENCHLRSEITLLQRQYEDQKHEIIRKDEELQKLRRKKLRVQFLHKFTYSQSYMLEQELINQLTKLFASQNIDLMAEICASTGSVINKVPLIISCNHAVSGQSLSTVDVALSDLGITRNRVVVVYHQKPEKDLPAVINEYKICNRKRKYQSLGGIYHLSHRKYILDNEHNQITIEKLMTFLLQLDKDNSEDSYKGESH